MMHGIYNLKNMKKGVAFSDSERDRVVEYLIDLISFDADDTETSPFGVHYVLNDFFDSEESFLDAVLDSIEEDEDAEIRNCMTLEAFVEDIFEEVNAFFYDEELEEVNRKHNEWSKLLAERWAAHLEREAKKNEQC